MKIVNLFAKRRVQFSGMSPCKGVEVHLHFGGMYCLHTRGHQAAIPGNIGIIIPDSTVKHLKNRLSGNSYCLGVQIYFTNPEPSRVNIVRAAGCCSCESSVEI